MFTRRRKERGERKKGEGKKKGEKMKQFLMSAPLPLAIFNILVLRRGRRKKKKGEERKREGKEESPHLLSLLFLLFIWRSTDAQPDAFVRKKEERKEGKETLHQWLMIRDTVDCCCDALRGRGEKIFRM